MSLELSRSSLPIAMIPSPGPSPSFHFGGGIKWHYSKKKAIRIAVPASARPGML